MENQMKTLSIAAAILFIAHIAVFFTAFGILGSAIGWPGSLDLPALENLPLIQENASAVFQGYYLYLLSVMITLPMWVLTRCVLKDKTDVIGGTFFDLALYTLVAAVIFKALGILRWLFAMPYLALTLAADPASAPMVTMMFDTLNLYAGKAGEHLGVQLFTALYIALIAFSMLRMKGAFKWLGAGGVLIAMSFLPYGDLMGLDNGIFLMVSGYSNTAWMIALAVTLFVKRHDF